MAFVVKQPKSFANRSALNLICAYADAPGTYYVDLSALFRTGQVNVGIQMQAAVSSITPSFTMVPIDEARDEVAAGRGSTLVWSAQSAVTAGSMSVFPVICTYARLVFAGPGVAYIGAW